MTWPEQWALSDIDDAQNLVELGHLLRRLRRRLARRAGGPLLTYRAIAAKTGWAHGVIGDYLAGKALPPTDRFDELIQLLGASAEEQRKLATARDRVEERRRARAPFGDVTRSFEESGATPRGLPPDIGGFVGRHRELAELDAVIRPSTSPDPVMICAVDGAAGVGKSALAVHAAHQLAHRFPDGQVYVNLHGFAPGAVPLPPGVALARLLRALGVPAADVPADEDEAGVMFRALSAARQLLVLLDNAFDATQVRPLLPGSSTCAVLVTSREVLATLDGATHVHLDVLPEPEAVELLGSIAGKRRLEDDRFAAEQVARQCGNLPLALRIAGARLVARPQWPIRRLADKLADAERRLDELQHADLQVRASFQVGYETLRDSGSTRDGVAAAAFPPLALFDGPDLSLPVAGCLLGQDPPIAEVSLERLVDAHLLEATAPGRYRFHDLLRLYARELAVQQLTPEARVAAIVRAVNWYAATIWQALRALRGEDSWRIPDGAPWNTGEMMFAGPKAAAEWLESERANLHALISQAGALPTLPPEIPLVLVQSLLPAVEHGP